MSNLAQWLPAWAWQTASAHDRVRVAEAAQHGTLQIEWPATSSVRAWARAQGWPTPWLGFRAAFLRTMLACDEPFALALAESGVRMRILVEHYRVPEAQLHEFDQWYAERSADGRPASWGILVEALRELRRALEAGIVVEIGDRTFKQPGTFYTWVHERYHMLEDGYDSWVGDDQS